MHAMNQQTHGNSRAGSGRQLLPALIIVIALCGNGTVKAEKSAPTQAAAALIDRLLNWLPGDYSNRAFLLANHRPDKPAAEAGTADSDMLTTYIRPARNPVLGRNLLFLEEYRGADVQTLERVRLYKLEVSDDGRGVEMLVLNPKDPVALRGARDDPARVEALSAAALRPDNPGCILHFHAGPEASIVGRMAYRGCRLAEQWVDYEIHVASDGHWVCYSRRQLASDAISWQLVPGFPCIFMARQ